MRAPSVQGGVAVALWLDGAWRSAVRVEGGVRMVCCGALHVHVHVCGMAWYHTGSLGAGRPSSRGVRICCLTCSLPVCALPRGTHCDGEATPHDGAYTAPWQRHGAREGTAAGAAS